MPLVRKHDSKHRDASPDDASVVVSGCSDPSIAVNVEGVFCQERKDHHGRHAYKRKRPRGDLAALAETAFLYFWGAEEYKQKGWYLSAKIGKETRLTWAYNSLMSERPPITGWIVNGTVDDELTVERACAVDEKLMVRGAGHEKLVFKKAQPPIHQQEGDELVKSTSSTCMLHQGISTSSLTVEPHPPLAGSDCGFGRQTAKSTCLAVDLHKPDAAPTADQRVVVSGCSDPSVAINIRGTFKYLGQSEGRPTWKLSRRGPLSEPAYLYFKTFDDVSGWWIGLSMRAMDKNLCFNGSFSQLPPLSGWMVEGVLDSTLQTAIRQPFQQLLLTGKKRKLARDCQDQLNPRTSGFVCVQDCDSETQQNLFQVFASAGWNRPQDEDSRTAIKNLLQNELSSQHALTYVCWASQGDEIIGALLLSVHIVGSHWRHTHPFYLCHAQVALLQYIVSTRRGTGWLLVQAALAFIHSHGIQNLYSAADLTKEGTAEQPGSRAAHLRWGFEEITLEKWKEAGLSSYNDKSYVQYMKYVGLK